MLDDRDEELSRMKKSENKFKSYVSTLRRSVADQVDNVINDKCSITKK